jgi:FlaA1/EpsC-like NDP-sugar epimerase
MGASKRLAEMALMDRPDRGTQFKAVRFGNVLGSSGSVVPIFREQIEGGGPVTVTSKDATRFFMTIPEAVELVLVAGAIGEDRTILVLEMGEPVKIDSLAKRMIELSGFVPNVDIPIVYTGLKQGEKECEELLTDCENVMRTEVDRVWVVKDEGRTEREKLEIGEILEIVAERDLTALKAFAQSLISGARLVVE